MLNCKPTTINWSGGGRNISAANLNTMGITGFQSISGSGTAILTIVWWVYDVLKVYKYNFFWYNKTMTANIMQTQITADRPVIKTSL